MAYTDNFPQRPVFSLDAANAGRLDPRMTFSRADTPPTYAAPSAVHYWSNEKHLSSENLLLDSKTGTANWAGGASGSAATATVTANYAASPDGTANQATRVQLDLSGATDTSSNSRYSQSIDLPSGDSVTFSVWLKSTDGASSYAIQVYRADGLADAATVTGVWQKFTTTATAAANAGFGIRIRGGQTPINADTADVLIWGANVSTTGQTVLSATTTQIHREYAPTLKSVATAGQPRFEYDPSSDGQSVAKGILIEGAATNLNPHSDALGSWSASTNITLTDDAGVGPTGSLNADLMVGTSATGGHSIKSAAITVASGSSYTFSGYFKSVGGEKVRLKFFRTSSPYTAEADVRFTLSGSGAVNAVSGSGTITSVGNGWYRCSATGTTLSTLSFLEVSTVSVSDETSYAGNSYNGVLCAGIQYESGSFASSLVSTSGSAATRAAESLSVDLTQAGFNGGPFTIVSETEGGLGAYPRAYALTDGTSSERLAVYKSSANATASTNWHVNSVTGGTDTVLSSIPSSASAGKLAVSYDTNDVSFCASGGTVTSDTSAVIPSGLDTLKIGALWNGATNQLNGHVKRIAVYNEALSDTNLQALTS